MRCSKYFLLFSVCLGTMNANAVSIYDNSVDAININMLSTEFMKQTHHGDELSEIRKNNQMYGTMKRVDEYGDDGSTLKTRDKNVSQKDSLAKDVWIDGEYINTRVNYGTPGTTRARYYMASVGFDSLDFDLSVGTIMFGGFFGYINGNVMGFSSNGETVGLFSRYNYKDFSIGALFNNGALKNDFETTSFNNGWLNTAIDASWKFRLDKTFYIEPEVYFGYTYVKADDKIRINNDIVATKNFNFWNLAPSIKLVEQISPDLYIGLFAKYTNTRGGKNDTVYQNTRYPGIAIKDYSTAGVNIEYNYKQFVFGLDAAKQFGKFDGWTGDINVKYLF